MKHELFLKSIIPYNGILIPFSPHEIVIHFDFNVFTMYAIKFDKAIKFDLIMFEKTNTIDWKSTTKDFSKCVDRLIYDIT